MAADHRVAPTGWRAAFNELMSRIAGRFGRVKPRRHARAMVLGLLSGLPRTNCWTIAEHVGDRSPDALQHLLARAVWDEDKTKTRCAMTCAYLTEQLGADADPLAA